MQNPFKRIQKASDEHKPAVSNATTRISVSQSAILAITLFAAYISGSGAGVPAPAVAQSTRQIEPDAGAWKTWLLKSGDQLRLPAPPNRTATQAEIKELKALAAKRDAKALDQIAYWNTGAPVYRWNEIFISEALKRNMNTLMAGRAMAYLHAALSDASIAAWDSKYAYNRHRPSQFDKSLTPAIVNPASPSYPSEHAVTAGAASVILAYLFPDNAERFDVLALEAANVFVVAGVQYPSDAKTGLELGREVAKLAIARAKADGSDAKWTGNVPTETGHWTGENPALPMMGTWKTWVLASPDALRPPAPPAFDSPQMTAELQAVKTFTRTAKSNADAMFWEYGAGGLRNYQFWNDQLTRKLFEYGLHDNPPRAARAYALDSIAYYDSAVACWDAKYAYWAIRPSQLDPEFKALFTSPNHPSYPSAHSCLSSASASVLAYLFPRDAEALNALVIQSGDARVWGGIHFPIDVMVGQTLGQAVAQKVIEWANHDGSSKGETSKLR